MSSYPSKQKRTPAVPPSVGLFASPLVSVNVNEEWWAHILGAVEPLAELDWWAGSIEQQELAVDQIEYFLEGRPFVPAIVEMRVVDCTLQVKYEGSDTWTDVFTLSDCASEPITSAVAETLDAGSEATAELEGGVLTIGVPRGADGVDGIDGTDGVDGVDGKDGANASTILDETETPDTDTLPHLCAAATEMAAYLTDEVSSRLEITKAAFNLANNLWDTLTDLMDSVPVVGNIFDELADVVQDLATAGDWDDAIGLISDPDFKDDVRCHLYCALKANAMTEFSPETVGEAFDTMLLWALTLLPSGPFLTLYGQIFTVYCKSIPFETVYRHAFVKLNDVDNDCEEVCLDCLEEPDTWCYSWTGSQLSAWTPSDQVFGGSDVNTVVGGAGVVNDGSTNGFGYWDCTIDLLMDLGASVITKVTWTSFGQSGSGLDTNWQCRFVAGGIVDDNFDDQQTGNGTHVTDPASITGDDLVFKIWANVGGGGSGGQGLSMVKFEGTGALPSFTGGSDCSE